MQMRLYACGTDILMNIKFNLTDPIRIRLPPKLTSSNSSGTSYHRKLTNSTPWELATAVYDMRCMLTHQACTITTTTITYSIITTTCDYALIHNKHTTTAYNYMLTQPAM